MAEHRWVIGASSRTYICRVCLMVVRPPRGRRHVVSEDLPAGSVCPGEA